MIPVPSVYRSSRGTGRRPVASTIATAMVAGLSESASPNRRIGTISSFIGSASPETDDAARGAPREAHAVHHGSGSSLCALDPPCGGLRERAADQRADRHVARVVHAGVHARVRDE